MELIQGRLKKSSRIYAVVMTLFWIYSAVVGLMGLVALLAALRIPADMPLAGYVGDALTADLTALADVTGGQLRLILLSGVLGGLLGVATYLIGARTFRAISKTGEPFARENADGLRTVAWLLAADAGLNVLLNVILPVEIPVVSIGGGQGALTSLMSGLLSVVLFFALVTVFRYGAELQRLSDETL